MTGSVESAVPLEDVMLSMDVVDTLRHRQLLVDRELDAEGRRERLIDRLRDIYTAQGIDVTDAVLEEGVRALEEDRFRYVPAQASFSTRFAHAYVNRDKWGKPLLLLGGLLAAGFLAYYMLVHAPRARQRSALPAAIDRTYEQLVQLADADDAVNRAQALLSESRQALHNDRYDAAQSVHIEMQSLLSRLSSNFDLRIVSRPNQLSGVWRVPSVNETTRNYYLIVEAVNRSGEILSVLIESEEDNRVSTVTVWGVRVDEATFEAVAADKRDDGIIQDDIIGHKKSGQLEPEYVIPTTGATITDW